MTAKTVTVLGGGTGGIVTARRLRRRLDPDDRVVIVERDARYRFAPSFLWVMSGARRPEQITADLGRLRRRGIEVVEATANELRVGDRTVETSEGALSYDRLVVALGAELAPEALPGFPEAAHNVYTLDGAAAAGRDLRELEGGRVVVLVSSLPYKCPAAPYEAAFLAEALLRHRGRREGSTIDVYTPEPFPMPTAGPALGDALSQSLAERGIGLHPERNVERIDTAARELQFSDGERVGYDLLLGVPPHRAPEVVRESPLAAETGFVPVDRATLATGAEDVYALGDVTTIPIAGGKTLPKAGVMAEAEADVVARRVAAELAGDRPTETYDGKGACFVEMGDGIAAFATGAFYTEGAPEVRLRRPGRRWHLAKVAFEKYWLRRWL